MELISVGIIKLVSLLCAVISGMLFAFVYRNYEQTVTELHNTHNHFYGQLKSTDYQNWLKKQSLRSTRISEESKSFEALPNGVILESEFLYSRVRVLCVILCKSRINAMAIKATWTQHCNRVMFFGPFQDNQIPVIKFPPLSSHASFCHSFIKLWRKHKNSFDWMLIASDETYAIIDNLRYYVSPLNASNAFYFGRAVKQYFTGIYNAADSGIVLSSGAANIIANVFSNETVCDNSYIDGIGTVSRNFEVSIAIILSKYGCNAVDTRDETNSGRFFSFTPEKQLIPGMISIFNSYWRSSVFLPPEGGNCCSDHAITFNGLQPSAMYLTEYILYHLAIFKHSPRGIGNKPPPYSSYKVRSDINNNPFNDIEIGTPLVYNINDQSNNKNAKNIKYSKKSISSFLFDFFAN